MPKVTVPTLPNSLTVSSWDKARGIIAKLTTKKTGVSEQLRTAKAALDAAPFGELNTSPLVLNKTFDVAGIKQVQDDYLRKYHPQFKALELAFGDLSRWLAAKAKEFEGDDKLKKFAPVLKLMSTDAHKFTFAVAWGTVSEENQRYLQDRIDSRVAEEKQRAQALPNMKKSIDNAKKAVEAAKKDAKLTLSTYERPLWAQSLRGIGAQIALAGRADPTIPPQFAGPMDVAKKLWADGNKPAKLTDLPARLKKDLDLVEDFKTIADKL